MVEKSENTCCCQAAPRTAVQECAADIYRRPPVVARYHQQPGLRQPAERSRFALSVQCWREWLLFVLCIVACLGIMFSVRCWQERTNLPPQAAGNTSSVHPQEVSHGVYLDLRK